jgi:hypothetical protein
MFTNCLPPAKYRVLLGLNICDINVDLNTFPYQLQISVSTRLNAIEK